MDVKKKNELLARGEFEHEEMWPYLTQIKAKAFTFQFEFGLESLPLEPGLIAVRGPRQYGKSTWLEQQLYDTVKRFGKGTGFCLNGDEIASTEEFAERLRELCHAYDRQAGIKRLFIDEVTAIPFWEKGLKRVLDEGLLRDVLVVTTGSKAVDLRHGLERLPGRKGRLSKSEYIFLPISYRQFQKNCFHKFRDKTWIAYLLTGGSPIACHDLCQYERLPEYFIQLTRDWVLGEVVGSGRSRISLNNILQCLFRFGGRATGFAKLAREAGLANNTVAAGYLEQLSDLLCVVPAWSWDPSRDILQPRKPCKFQFINLAMVVAFHPASIRTVDEFDALSSSDQGAFLEWLVAQEIWRRSALEGRGDSEAIGFWCSKEHEIDFVTPSGQLIEVKKEQAGPLEFHWFTKIFPREELTVVCGSTFSARQVRGLTFEQFLSS